MTPYRLGSLLLVLALAVVLGASYAVLRGPGQVSPLRKYAPCKKRGGPGVPLYDCVKDSHSWYLQDGAWVDLGLVTLMPLTPRA